jgi:hypothetical protein
MRDTPKGCGFGRGRRLCVVPSEFNAVAKRAENLLPGEQRDGRGNGSYRDESVARQVRDLPGFLALSLPFPDCRLRPAARNCSPFAAGFRPVVETAVLKFATSLMKGLGLFAKKTLEQAGRATDGKTSRRRRSPHGVTKRRGRIAELGPRANDRHAAGGMFFRPADWVFDREWPQGLKWFANFIEAFPLGHPDERERNHAQDQEKTEGGRDQPIAETLRSKTKRHTMCSGLNDAAEKIPVNAQRARAFNLPSRVVAFGEHKELPA